MIQEWRNSKAIVKVYKDEIDKTKGECTDINQSLNIKKNKPKELTMDFRRLHKDHSSLNIKGKEVERVSGSKFLGPHHRRLQMDNQVHCFDQKRLNSGSTL